MRYAVPATLAAMLVVLMSGCAGGPQHVNPANRALSTSESNPPPSPTDSEMPAVPRPFTPTAPPNGPTDQLKSQGWIVGTITADSSGPCYGLETDEGVQYTLHSTAGTRLEKGARVRVKAAPARVRINCGPGRLMEMTAVEPVR